MALVQFFAKIHSQLFGRRRKPEEVRKQTHRQTLDSFQAIFIIHITNLPATKLFSYTESSPKKPSVDHSDLVKLSTTLMKINLITHQKTWWFVQAHQCIGNVTSGHCIKKWKPSDWLGKAICGSEESPRIPHSTDAWVPEPGYPRISRLHSHL
jgi:hypothetical protein